MEGSIKKHILIVDDAEDIQALLQEFLTEEGYQVSSALTGMEALTFLQGVAELPDLILLDLMMPSMDGLQFCQEREQDFKLAQIPVIVMTADSNIQAQSVGVHAQGFLKKPFLDLETILKTIKKFIK